MGTLKIEALLTNYFNFSNKDVTKISSFSTTYRLFN